MLYEYLYLFLDYAILRHSVHTGPTRTETLQAIPERRTGTVTPCVSSPNFLHRPLYPDPRFPCRYICIRGYAITIESYYKES